jgi:hypothetical protein
MIGTSLLWGQFFFDDLSSIESDFEPLEADPSIRKPIRAIYILPVVEIPRPRQIDGLLLHATDRKNGEYRRIGVVSLWVSLSRSRDPRERISLKIDAHLRKRHEYVALNSDKSSGLRYVMEII